MIEYLYTDDFHFMLAQECYIDPLETELKGETVYLHSANSTLKKPLEPKEGFDVVFNPEVDEWEYIDLTPSEPETEEETEESGEE